MGALLACLVTVWLAGPVRADDPPALPDARVRAWQTGLLAPDRLAHASLAFSGGLAVGLVARRPVAAFASAMTFGVAKELFDRRHSRFDPVDLVADAIGAGFAAIAVSSLER
jgi:hypothetical protein